MKTTRYAVVLLIASAVIAPVLGQSTNTEFIKFAKAHLHRSMTNSLDKAANAATNSLPVFTDSAIKLSGTGEKRGMNFGTPTPFENESAGLLTKKEDPWDLNFVEDAIDRGDMVTEILRGGRDRGRDSFSLRMMELGPRSHFDWFVDNTYPAHLGNIGKDEWVIGFKVAITQKPNKKWRSR